MWRGQEERGRELLRCCRGVLVGSGIAVLLCAGLLLVASVGISQGFLSGEVRYQITVVCCVLGSFCGTVLTVRNCPMKGVPAGLSVGGTFFMVLLTVGVLLYDTVSFENGGLGLLCASLCGGMAAGLLGKGKGRKRKRRGR